MCTNCHRRTETCIYPPSRNPVEATDLPVMALPTLSDVPQLPPTRLLPLSHPMLVTWWFKDISPGINPASPAEKALWRGALSNMQLADYSYLWHGILSTHLMHTLPTSERTAFGKTVDLAYQHHLAASSNFSSAGSVVSDRNWLAVLTFGISVIVFQFATQQICPDPLFDYIEMLLVLRNSSSLAASVIWHFRRSSMWPLVQDRVSSEHARTKGSGVHAAVQYLAEAVMRAEFVDETNYRSQTLQAFRYWLHDCRACPRIWRDYMYWPGKMPEEFYDALRRNDEVSLLMVLHWCAVLRLGPKRWFMETWILRTAELVRSRVKGDWGRCLAWPCEVLWNDSPAEGLAEGQVNI